MGPVIVVEYQVSTEESVWSKESSLWTMRIKQQNRTAMLPVAKLNVDAEVDTQKRFRGIYGVPVYATRLQITGEFDPADFERVSSKPDFVTVKNVYLWVNTSDQRGFLDIPTLNWNNSASHFEAGGHASMANRGIVTPLTADSLRLAAKFSIDLKLRGTQSLNLVPTGKVTAVQMHSLWPHPKFTGHYLPVLRSINESGFEATWNTTELASNVSNNLATCNDGHCELLLNNQFGVSLIEPVDVYMMTERAVKYGLLYVVLVFALVLGSELYRDRNVHPVQYLMVGVGVSVFYLLLLALSEHIAFSYAYSIATFMCSSLLTYYGVQIFGTLRGGLVFGGVIAFLYALLFVILNAEDIALLLGAMIVFIAVVALMIATRSADKLNRWLPGSDLSKSEQ